MISDLSLSRSAPEDAKADCDDRVHLVLARHDLLDILIGFVDQATVGNLLDLQLVLELLDHR